MKVLKWCANLRWEISPVSQYSSRVKQKAAYWCHFPLSLLLMLRFETEMASKTSLETYTALIAALAGA